MRHPRNIVAIAVVTMALCADRTVTAGTSSHRPAADTLAGQIVRKLQISFRKVVPAVSPFHIREDRFAAVASVRFVAVERERAAPPVSPLHSRLPPPTR